MKLSCLPLPAFLLAGAALAANEPQSILLNGDAGGKLFEGIGIVDGGGATSVLLKDYPEPQRSQMLDLIYKPKFGASISALYLEIPGDGNSTQGSMPSHMHTRDDLDYHRGYMWWLLKEAKKRNPALSLDGTAWSAPGWIGDNGKLYERIGNQGDAPFFSQDAAEYYVSWLKGLRDVHGLELDAMGARNEKGVSYGFIKALRRTLDANGFDRIRLHAFDNWPDDWKFDFVRDMPGDPALREAIDIISAHVNAPKSVVQKDVQDAAERMGKPIWNTEQHVYIAGYEGLIGIVEAFNENYIRSGATRITNWYGIGGVYKLQPYSGEKEAAIQASWPWSGHYAPNPSLWGYAHYGQFSEIGWAYLKGGSGDLAGGGTYVTLKSPGSDYSVIIETKDAKGPQQLRLQAAGGLSGAALAVWRSNASEQFVRLPDLVPANGAVTLTLDPNTVYSLTTTRGQQKGGFAGVPASSVFPFPYRENFEQYGDSKTYGYLPRYYADISGAFELSRCPARKGTCLRQMAPVRTISWGPDWQSYTIVGDDKWKDYDVSTDVYLNAGEAAAVMGRVNHVGTGYGVIPKGYFLQLKDSGEVSLVVVRGKKDKKALIGDSEQQAAIRAQNDASEGGEKVLAIAKAPSVKAGQWHSLKLRFAGNRITGFVDDRQVIEAQDDLYAHGMTGLMAPGYGGRKLSMPWFDNVAVNGVGATPAVPLKALPGQGTLYPATARRD